jgi:DNA invertase Pin-like site-specific DNA recombinase
VTRPDAPVRVATYAHAVRQRDRAELARRHRRLAAAVTRWRGAVLVGQYGDAGPTPPLGRPGLARCFEDARAGRFDVLVVEHLGRLAPSPDEAGIVVGAFGACGVRVHPLGSGHRRLVAAGTAAAIVKLLGG